jgi:hypothetical protein
MRKILVAVALAVITVPVAATQYPKTLTLTVTRITRTHPRPGPDCDYNCSITLITVVAHTSTLNFVLECEERWYPSGVTMYCAGLQTGTYEAKQLAPDVVNFWVENPPNTETSHPVLYRVVEEARR